MKRLLIRAAGITCVLLAGGVQSSAGEPTDAPREALIEAISSLVKDSESQMLAYFDATPQERQGLSGLYAFNHAGIAFRGAFIKTYGQQAWADFQDRRKGPPNGNARLDLFGEKEMGELRRARIELQGDEAYCRLSNSPHLVRMVKAKDRWLVDATSLFPGGTDAKRMGKLLTSAAATVRKYQKAIGHPGITPEDIDAELGRALVKVMAGVTIHAPHRFDIDNRPEKK